jgi:hypothetical protein
MLEEQGGSQCPCNKGNSKRGVVRLGYSRIWEIACVLVSCSNNFGFAWNFKK